MGKSSPRSRRAMARDSLEVLKDDLEKMLSQAYLAAKLAAARLEGAEQLAAATSQQVNVLRELYDEVLAQLGAKVG